MGDLRDFQGFGERLQRELDAIDEDHHPKDQDHVWRWVHSLDGDVKDSTQAVYLQNLRTAADARDGALVDLDEASLEALSYTMRHTYEHANGGPGLADGTVHNIKVAIRSFLQDVDAEGTEWADDMELSAPDSDPVVPEEMLLPDDIAALRQGANNYRDIAMIEFLADTGARLTLMGSLRVGDIDLSGNRPTYRPNPEASGLKGAAITDYPLIDSQATLRTYMNDIHPRPEQDDVAFFHKLPGGGVTIEDDDDGSLTPHTVRKQLRKAADHGDIDKPVNPHNFRHSAITRMVREGYTRSQIEHRVHWDVDSDMWEVYEHITGEQHTEDIFEKAGIGETEGDDTSPEREPCSNCKEPVPRHLDFCPRCHSPQSPEARETLELVEDDGVEALGEGDLTDSERRIVAAALQLARDQPSLTRYD